MSKQATRWITTKQVCEHLQISRATLYRWKAEGLPVHSGRGQLRFDIQEVDDWLRSRCSDSDAARDGAA